MTGSGRNTVDFSSAMCEGGTVLGATDSVRGSSGDVVEAAGGVGDFVDAMETFDASAVPSAQRS